LASFGEFEEAEAVAFCAEARFEDFGMCCLQEVSTKMSGRRNHWSGSRAQESTGSNKQQARRHVHMPIDFAIAVEITIDVSN
jgi:hypothetical protein